jgi:iron complex transport system permease protein
MVPHAVRLCLGPDNRLVIPASLLAGAMFLVLTDTLARTVAAPTEIPVGAVTSFLGAPFFAYLLRSRYRSIYP